MSSFSQVVFQSLPLINLAAYLSCSFLRCSFISARSLLTGSRESSWQATASYHEKVVIVACLRHVSGPAKTISPFNLGEYTLFIIVSYYVMYCHFMLFQYITITSTSDDEVSSDSRRSISSRPSWTSCLVAWHSIFVKSETFFFQKLRLLLLCGFKTFLNLTQTMQRCAIMPSH